MSQRSRKQTAVEYRRVLASIFEFMFASGFRAEEVTKASAVAIERAKHSGFELRPVLPGGIALAALVLDAWHRDRRYLTRLGRPRMIKSKGAVPSLEALIRSQSEHCDIDGVMLGLRSHKLIFPCGRGRFRPASDMALLSDFDPLAIQHVARTLAMLLRTVRQNLIGGPVAQRLIERNAEVPDLPLEYIQAFRRFAELQGWIFLRTINDWLEVRRIRPVRKEHITVPAGVHVHAYLGRPVRSRTASAIARVKPARPSPSAPSSKSSPHCS